MRNPLFDSDFLRKLDLEHNKHILGRVISLTLDEQAREEITGKVTGGTINIDGSSAVRRTCNLTLVAKDIATTDYYWALTNKIKIEIGVKNYIDKRYPEIIWFPMGTYILTSFSVSYGLSNITVSLSGKDKMAMLNGDLGGVLTASSYDFANIDNIRNIYTPIILSREKFITSGDLITAQSSEDLDLNKYIYFDKNVLEYTLINEDTPLSPQRLKNDYEVFACKDENGNYIITTQYSSNSDKKYYIVKAKSDVTPITTISSPTSLYKIKKNYFCKDSNKKDIRVIWEEEFYREATNDEDENIEFLSLATVPLGIQSWIPVNFIPEEEEIDTGKIYAPYKYYYYKTDEDEVPYISTTEDYDPSIQYYEPGPNYYQKEIDIQRTKMHVKDILSTLLHEHGKELYSNIIIEDIPKYGKELLELSSTYEKDYLYLLNEYSYKEVDGKKSYSKQNQYYILNEDLNVIPHSSNINIFYRVEWNNKDIIYIEATSDEYMKAVPKDDKVKKGLGKFFKKVDPSAEKIPEAIYYKKLEGIGAPVKDLQDDVYGAFNPFIDDNICYFIATINGESKIGQIIRVSPGQTIGYRETDLTYPGELTATNGENITIILDKIKNFLGNYEYYYNLKGQFVFREKRNFLNKSFSSFFSNEDTEYYDFNSKKISYSFENNVLLTSYSKSPAIGNIKNDFCVWGERKGVTGVKLPIHMRYAIDKKPSVYWSYPEKDGSNDFIIRVYCASEKDEKKAKKNISTKLNILEKFGYSVNADKGIKFWCVDWRELIFQMNRDFQKHAIYDSSLSEKSNKLRGFDEDFFLKIRELNENLYNEKGLNGYEQYYIDLRGFWRDLYNPFFEWEEPEEKYSENDYYSDGTFKYWTKKLDTPETLDFWFDFLDITGGELDKFSVKNIGQRTKAKTDLSVKAIKYRDTPPILFYEKKDGEIPSSIDNSGDYSIIILEEGGAKDFLSISSQNIDAEEWVNNSIYSDTLCTETISITAVPVYYLSPNTLINLKTDDINVDGDYIINRITYSLSHNGMMQIQAIKNQPYIT